MSYIHVQSHDPAVILGKTACMQQLAGAVRAGYHWWTSGIVPHDRAQALVSKFKRLYQPHLGKDERYRMRKRGEARTMLLLWQHNHSAAELTWFLLVTDDAKKGSDRHAAHQLEQLGDARVHDERITITGYELISLTRRDARRPSWTWRMTNATYRGWRDRVIEACGKQSDTLVRQAWWSLHEAPGFGPIREQCKVVKHLFLKEWIRRRGNQMFPAPNRRLFYLDFIAVRTLPLSTVIRRIAG